MPMMINKSVKIEANDGTVVFERDDNADAVGEETAAKEIMACGASGGDRDDILDGLVAGQEFTVKLRDEFNYVMTTIRWYWRGRRILDAKKRSAPAGKHL